MRLFIALELPSAVKTALGEVQRSLQASPLPVRWVAPHAMHLTLVFLGETDSARLEPIGRALREATAGIGAFELQLGQVGAFPNTRRPQVVWVGISGATATLVTLQGAVAQALEPLGFPREARPYSAHLTLGRVSRDAIPQQRSQIGAAVSAAAAPPALAWRADHVVLFESQLRPSGPEYHARDTIVLP